jgi:hypothetical protein
MSFEDQINTPAAATPAAPTTATPSTVSQPTTQVAPQTPATPATPNEDRSNWVPPYRLREQTQRFEQSLQAERARWQAEKEAYEAKVRALVGVTPPENPQIDEVRNQFKQVFPDLDYIGSQRAQLEEILALKDELKASMNAQWEAHNRNATDRLYKAAEQTYGQPLSDDAKRTLGASFIGYLQSNPEAYTRYQYDTSVAEEFWKAFSDRFVDPVRRSAAVNTANRIPTGLPQDSPSGGIQPSSAPQPQTQDERLRAALDVYKAKSRYGFGE